MDAVKIALEVQKGLSIFCATCVLYWQGLELGLPKCAAKGVCGSPLAGLDFPYYRGPITDFSRWCFVCGSSSYYGVSVSRSERVLGMCREHIRMLQEVTPCRVDGGAKRTNGVEVVNIQTGSGRVASDRFFGVSKKTLGQTIFEAEADFRVKAG